MKTKINFGSKPGGKSIFEKKPPKGPKIEYPGEPNIEVDAEVELTELQKQFREKAKAEKELKDKNVSSNFWSCIVFKNEEQRNQFCQLLGLKDEDLQYLNGQNLIKALELRIQTIEEKAPGKFRCNKEIFELSLNP